MKNKKRPKKRRKTKTPWGMQRTIAMSLLAHGTVIVVIIAMGWRQFSIEKSGGAIFVNDVVIGNSEGGQAQPQAHSKSPLPRGEGGRSLAPEAHSPLAEANSNFVTGNTDGSGTGNGTGANGGGSGTGAAGNPVLAEIRRRIEQSKRYPNQAREQHIEGRVDIQFLIQPNGRVENVRITRSSGTPVLDEAAIQAVQHSAPLPYYESPIDLSLAFRLR